MGQEKAWYRTKTFDNWHELERQLEEYYLARARGVRSNHWVFRGVSNISYGLLNSLERELNSNHYWAMKPAEAERFLIKEYKKRAHHYVHDLSRETSEIEWLALMQHHGAPTRLLDWTRSPYVALFFALRGAYSSRENPAVWILNIGYCTWVAREAFRKALSLEEAPSPDDLFSLSLEKTLPVVFPIEPLRANARLAIQQGVLLYPGDVAKSFDENLSGCVGRDDLVRFEIVRDLIPQGLHRLHMMNINHATLFPGIDGFSTSMKDLLWATDHIPPQS